MSGTAQAGAPREIVLEVDGRRIAALHRPPLPAPAGAVPGRRPDGTPGRHPPRLLCLHGWLDNANSFVPLMPCLPGVDIVAIDLPGHGASDWLEGGYSIEEAGYRARRVMQALGWESCHLAGHSLGGCIAAPLAVAAPEAIRSLILLEASGPLTEEAEALPARLRRALAERLDPARFRPRDFADVEAAVDVRLAAARMARSSARAIVERQLRSVDGVWRWRFDPRLREASPRYWTEAQVRAVLGAVACPVLTVVAGDGFLAARAESEARLARLAGRTSLTLPGHHHVHMDDPRPVAAAIARFLGTA